jgi:hypothetical protein
MDDPLTTQVVAVLMDVCRYGVDTEPGIDALQAGVREILRDHRPSFALGLAIAGWAGAIEGVAEVRGVDPCKIVAEYVGEAP